MKKHKAVRVFRLVCGVTIVLFFAGIVVPSFLLTRMPANYAWFPGSLHTMKIAGIALTYKSENILFAALGAALGAAMAWTAASPRLTDKRLDFVAIARFLARGARAA